MGCGCGGAAQQEQWLVKFPDGSEATASSDVQARQWIARAGGGTMRKTQTPVKVS